MHTYHHYLLNVVTFIFWALSVHEVRVKGGEEVRGFEHIGQTHGHCKTQGNVTPSGRFNN